MRWWSLIRLLAPPRLAFGGGGGAPSPSSIPPPPPPPPQLQSPQGADAAADARRRAQASSGFGSTILTGPMGLQDQATTAKKSLLGG